MATQTSSSRISENTWSECPLRFRKTSSHRRLYRYIIFELLKNVSKRIR